MTIYSSCCYIVSQFMVTVSHALNSEHVAPQAFTSQIGRVLGTVKQKPLN